MYKIRLIPKIKISPRKYASLIEESIHFSPYATGEFLDLVAPRWDMLMLGDYEAVMPIPYERAARYFWRMKVMQPGYCQQLGIFSRWEITPEIFEAFFHRFLTLKPKTYAFHSALTPLIKSGDYPDVRLKNNYILDLNTDYDQLMGKYSQNIRRNIQKAHRQGYSISKDIPVSEFLALKKRASRHKISRKVWRSMERILRMSAQYGTGYTLGIKDNTGWHAAIFLLTGRDRIIHLISAADELAKKTGAMSLLFDSIIEEYAGQKIILDFEGSEIPGVARFFQGFGTVNEPYYVYSRLR